MILAASFLADEAMATDPPDLTILTRSLEVSVVAARLLMVPVSHGKAYGRTSFGAGKSW